MQIQYDVPLAPLTTFGLGGSASHFVRVENTQTLAQVLDWAADRHEVLVLGGGSNLVIADEGYDGLVVQLATQGLESTSEGTLRVAAGVPWDDVVAYAVTRGWAGIECLSGIPGLTGATPIQNVGAYGQEVSEVISSVTVVDRVSGASTHIAVDDCAFAYRDSRFKREPGRWIVMEVHLALKPAGMPSLRYRELQRAMENEVPTLAAVRSHVLRLRRAKSMVVDANDPDSRSAGSFFTNPIVEDEVARGVAQRAVELGVAESVEAVPCFDAGGGRSKLAAAWLIERAGIDKGTRHGGVAVSRKHSLALVHRGDGTTAQLLELARRIRDQVRETFDVELTPEPTMVGVTL